MLTIELLARAIESDRARDLRDRTHPNPPGPRHPRLPQPSALPDPVPSGRYLASIPSSAAG